MQEGTRRQEARGDPPGPGGRELLGVAALYMACLAVVAAPLLAQLGSHLPCHRRNLGDPLQHLWILRWYKTCLLEGRVPILCNAIQYPIGAPLGNFSPLHLQALLFLPLSTVFPNDVLCFNLIWLVGLTTTGLGTYLLIRQVIGDRVAAALGGLLAMLGAPVMSHAQATHLELVFVGTIPLFLAVWVRFVEGPSRRCLLAAVGAYWLVALAAAYYAVLSVVPAALFVAWWTVGAARGGHWREVRSRLGWLAAFAPITLAGLLVIFGNQIWAQANGYTLPRPPHDLWGTPPWTYVVPTAAHRLAALLPFDVYAAAGLGTNSVEQPSYLGIVTLALAYYVLVRKVPFAYRGYWWLLLAVLVLLSCGGFTVIGTRPIPLPGLWLKAHVAAFEPIRVFARFNQLAAVVAAMIAAVGYHHLRARLPRRGARVALLIGLLAVALLDLAPTSFDHTPLPDLPTSYRYITSNDPEAAIVDIPQFNTAGGKLNAACAYWQSHHRARTTAGYSGQSNVPYDDLMVWSSPFWAARLADPSYPADPEAVDIGIVRGVRFLDYVRLYLRTHGLRYVVLHRWPGSVDDYPSIGTGRVAQVLDPARVYEDAATVVYDRERLKPPARPVLLCTEGWREIDFRVQPPYRVVERTARIVLDNPRPLEPLHLTFEAQAFRRRRTVTLRSDGRKLARWVVEPGAFRTYQAGPLRLPGGTQELVLESDGDDRPVSRQQVPTGNDMRPFSLRVAGIAVEARPEKPTRPAIAGGAEAGSSHTQTR